MRTKLTLTAAFVALTFGQAAFAANQNLSTDVLVVSRFNGSRPSR